MATNIKRKEKCLCHCIKYASGAITPFTDISWTSFKQAADVRKDSIYDDMIGHWQKPYDGYHRKCYQQYTNKTNLTRILKRKQEPIETSHTDEIPSLADNQCNDDPLPPKRFNRSSIDTTDYTKCLFCQDTKYSKEAKDSEKLQNLETITATNTIKKYAKQSDNQRLLLATDGKDLVALEVKYHRTCYRAILRHNVERTEQAPSDIAVDEFMNRISQVFQENKVCFMNELLDLFKTTLEKYGVDGSSYTTQKLKNKLINHYPNQLHFWRPKTRAKSELVYCENQNLGTLLENQDSNENGSDYEMEINDDDDDLNINNELYHASMFLHNCLISVKRDLSWPPDSQDISKDNLKVPIELTNFLDSVIYGEGTTNFNEKVSLSEKKESTIFSIAQDLIFAATKGRTKTPKHISLAIAVKNMTGSKGIVHLLNKFGHAVSNSQVDQLETAIANKQRASRDVGIYIPKAIVNYPNVIIQFCYDNNDILEETLSGKGTFHVTNGIICQRIVHTCSLPPVQIPEVNMTTNEFQSVALQDFIPGPKTGSNKTIQCRIEHLTEIPAARIKAEQKDFVWLLSRMSPEKAVGEVVTTDNDITCAWSGFNAVTSSSPIPPKTNVGYCQVIDSPPTELQTVYTLLKNSMSMADSLGQNDVVIVFDLAIYAKALEVIWRSPEDFTRVVLRLGEFHTACMFMGVIGKRFGDAGLSDILIEADIVGTGSLNGVINGHHYNRALRCHKIVAEALFHILWQTFIEWVQSTENILPQASKDKIKNVITNLQTNCNAENMENAMTSPEMTDLLAKFQLFCEEQEDPMPKFWISYIEIVLLLLRFIRASREGDWTLHLNSIAEMMPWVHAYDRMNYGRYLPWYWSEMITLGDTHPEAAAAFETGDFVVQRSSNNPFGQIAVDQTIEQTINRDTKTKGGIIGFSRNKSAVQKWIYTAHERAAITEKCRELAGISVDLDHNIKEANKSRALKDATEVSQVINTIDTFMNPFKATDIINLSSGVKATPEVEYDLLQAKNIGEKSVEAFIKERIHSQDKSINAVLPQHKLKSFTSMKEKKRSAKENKEKIANFDRDIFARMLVIAHTKQMDLKHVFTYELGRYPWSLAALDGTILHPEKSDLMDCLEANVPQLRQVPLNACWIFDGMAILRMIKFDKKKKESKKVKKNTFSDLAKKILDDIFSLAKNSNRVDFVTDTYPEISIKTPEHDTRAEGGSIKVTIVRSSQELPNLWKEFLSDSSNKIDLMKFLIDEWTRPCYSKYFMNPFYMNCGNIAYRFQAEGADTTSRIAVPELDCDHDEADTRMLIHAKHASDCGIESIIIRTPDTDVVVIALYHQSKFTSDLLLLLGTGNHKRLVSASAIASSIGEEMVEALPGLHAISGCDSTSGFVGHGKKKFFKLAKENRECCALLSDFGNNLQISDGMEKRTEKLICTVYGQQNIEDVNEARYRLFIQKSKSHSVRSQTLPPTKDALRHKIKRVNFQSYAWKNGLLRDMNLPSPHGHGWTVADNLLAINWVTKAAAPEELLKVISCSCKGSCDTMRCSCRKNGLSCTDACKCELDKCTNRPNQENSDDETDD